MQIPIVNKKYDSSFGNGFYNITRELESSIPLSRALVDLCGASVPWVIMANNSAERKEKIRKFSFDYIIAYLSPFVTLPLSNRFAMKYIAKLNKNFWSNNHKAIHISNAFLKDADSMMSELYKMGKNMKKNPIESLYYKLNPNKQYNPKLDVEELLKSVGGDKEKLRQKLIRSKNAVFISDCLFTVGTVGSFLFINNEITKKKTGQSGFSAEMRMADKSIVEKRADSHEKNKKRKYLTFAALLTGATLGMSLAGFATLYSKSSNKIIKSLRDCSKYFDYTKGIYMSRLPFFLNTMVFVAATLLAARNSTERKDLAIRSGVGNTVFFGGDLVLGSLFTNLSDRIFGTKLRKDDGSNNSFINKIFPKVKHVEQVIEEVEQGKISSVNKKVSVGIFWANILILMGSIGYLIPKVINKMIRKDVDKDVQAQKSISGLANFAYSKPLRMEDFIRNK